MLTQGIGGSPPGIAGPTYMDEMYTQKEFGIAISLLYIITFVGFPISVLFAGASLNMYVTLDPPEGMNPSRPEWVGAWWLGFLVPAVVIFFVSFIVMLFPTQMPAAKVCGIMWFIIQSKLVFFFLIIGQDYSPADIQHGTLSLYSYAILCHSIFQP